MSFVAVAVAVAGCVALAGEAPKPSLKAELVAGIALYELDPAISGKDQAQKLRQLEKRGAMPPKPPKINLTLRLTNAGDEPLSIRVGGDQSSVILALEGPGAVNISPNLATTLEFRLGKAVALKSGQSHDIPITSLASGSRNIGRFSYWTEPGEHTLKATFRCQAGERSIKADTEPIKIKVVEPGKAPKAAN